MRDWRMDSSIAMFMNALCVSSGIKRQVSMVFRSFVGDGWHGCGLKLLCSEKLPPPLFIGLILAWWLMVVKSANTGRPPL
jgi:hypothetical protein